MNKDNGVISIEKIGGDFSDYICKSIWKPLLVNPFLVALMVILIIWGVDAFNGKHLKTKRHCELVQHFVITYVVVLAGFVLNNTVLTCKQTPKETSEKTETPEEEVNMTSEYVAY